MKLERNWSLVPVLNGQAVGPVALAKAASVIGRDPGCELHFPDNSISRRHAEFLREGDLLRVRDLGSRNGLRVNGVPRLEAVLQHGDTIEIGSLTFQVSALPGMPMPKPVTELPLAALPAQEATRRQRLALTKLGSARNLSTLYHVCAWLAEDLEESAFTEKCLRVLHEGMEALEVQLYEPSSGLTQCIGEKDKTRAIRLIPFLTAQYHAVPEAVIVTGADLRKYQLAAARFQFLIGPLRPLHAAGEFPFLAVIRPVDWREFTTDDRVLLQTVCQLWMRAVKRVRHVDALRLENASLKKHSVQPRLLGTSDTLETLREQVLKAARTNITVTLCGETGSGKEVIAHLIHQQSQRASGPFVKVNCAAIPDSLIESELFGHDKGAFTDARTTHRGKFEQAHGGTLFLDEIGDLPLAVQGKFLRALETGEIEKLGSERPVTVDVRIIAASHRDLQQMTKDRQFREDLFYRLNVLTMRVPPLREHTGDIAEIATHFLTQFCAQNGLAELELAPDAIKALQRHRWPGNVRELRNVIQRCAIQAGGSVISAAQIRAQLAGATK